MEGRALLEEEMGESTADGEAETLGARGCRAVPGSDRPSCRARARTSAGDDPGTGGCPESYVPVRVLRILARKSGATGAEKPGVPAVCGGCGVLELVEG